MERSATKTALGEIRIRPRTHSTNPKQRKEHQSWHDSQIQTPVENPSMRGQSKLYGQRQNPNQTKQGSARTPVVRAGNEASTARPSSGAGRLTTSSPSRKAARTVSAISTPCSGRTIATKVTTTPTGHAR